MRHPSFYLEWYNKVPEVKHDFRSSGINNFKYELNLGEINLSINYAHGNLETRKTIAQRYNVRMENIFLSTEGASGQNLRIIKCLAEKNRKKNEAIVEYPTYEPLLRQVQEHFPRVKRLERKENEAYRLDADRLRKIVSEKTALLVITNSHAPSGAIADKSELQEIMHVAREHDIYVLCDEIYAEFNREAVPTLFSIDKELGVVTTSFSKAYGLGGLKLGIAIAEEKLVNEFYNDLTSTVGNSSNIVEIIATELLTKGKAKLEQHKQKWINLKEDVEQKLDEKGFEYFPNKAGITYWVKLPLKDTYKWINEKTIPKHNLAAVPGAFFLFKNNYEIRKSNMIRLGLGRIDLENPCLEEAFEVMDEALR